MSIYIVQGWGGRGPWLQKTPTPEGTPTPPAPRPLGPSAGALLARPAGSTSGFHFSLRSETKRQKREKTIKRYYEK